MSISECKTVPKIFTEGCSTFERHERRPKQTLQCRLSKLKSSTKCHVKRPGDSQCDSENANMSGGLYCITQCSDFLSAELTEQLDRTGKASLPRCVVTASQLSTACFVRLLVGWGFLMYICFHLLERQNSRERGEKLRSSICWFTRCPQWPDWSWDPRTPPGSPVWVAGAQVPESSSALRLHQQKARSKVTIWDANQHPPVGSRHGIQQRDLRAIAPALVVLQHGPKS